MLSSRTFLDIPPAPHYEQQIKWEIEVTHPVLTTNEKIVKFCQIGGCGTQEYKPAPDLPKEFLDFLRETHEADKEWARSCIALDITENYFEKRGMLKEKA